MGKKKKLLLSDFDEECFNDADVAFGETNQIFIFVIQYISLFRKKYMQIHFYYQALYLFRCSPFREIRL